MGPIAASAIPASELLLSGSVRTMYNPLKWFLLVAVFLPAAKAAPSASRETNLNNANILLNRGKWSMTSDLQGRAVCKFSVESEQDYDSKIKYENVKCINEVLGNCEQLKTSLTLPSGRSLTIKSACVFVNKTVSSEQAQSLEEPPVVTK
jgi:hypothetical protein